MRIQSRQTHLVALDESDRDVTMFLWLRDPNDPDNQLMTYRFKAMLFGDTCSPFILCAAILKHLDNNHESLVSDHVRRDTYVDNIISGFQREDDVVKFNHDTRDLMSGCELQPAFMEVQQQHMQTAYWTQTTKVLGYRWDAEAET